MTPLPPTTLTFLVDGDHIYVSVRIDGVDHDLCRFTDITEAGSFASKWVTNRGLRFGRDSARRLSEAQRLDAKVVTLDVVRDGGEQDTEGTTAWARAWVDASEGIIPWPFTP